MYLYVVSYSTQGYAVLDFVQQQDLDLDTTLQNIVIHIERHICITFYLLPDLFIKSIMSECLHYRTKQRYQQMCREWCGPAQVSPCHLLSPRRVTDVCQW